MAVLSRDELINLNPQSIYRIGTFILNIEAWNNLDSDLLNCLNESKRFLFDEQIIGSLPETKGIYFFMVEPEFNFMQNANYLMYVGRVMNKNTFRLRFYDYVRCIGNRNVARNKQLLTNLWPNKTWVYIFELNVTDEQIFNIERNLIDSIIPPMNNSFSAEISNQSRSIYN
jgi:hypothetical protein